MAELIDYLTEEEIGTLAEFLKDAKAITTGKGPLANEASRIIHKAPSFDNDTVLFRYLPSRREWAGAGEFKEPGFILGADEPVSKGDGKTLFKITIPAGVPVVWLPGGAYLADRGQVIDFDGSRGSEEGSKADVYATVKTGKALTASAQVRFNTGWIPTEDQKKEFHLQGEHDQHTHGGHGGGGGKRSKAERGAARRAKLKIIRDVLQDIAGVVGSLITIGGAVAGAAYIVKMKPSLADAAKIVPAIPVNPGGNQQQQGQGQNR